MNNYPWLLELLAAQSELHIGEVIVKKQGDSYSLQGPSCQGEDSESPCSMEEFRQFVRVDDAGRYRPLSGAKSLRQGWYRKNLSWAQLIECIDVVYPQALTHLEQARNGLLRTPSLPDVLSRQTGNYARARNLSKRGVALCSELLCGSCVRNPCWVNLGKQGLRGSGPKDGLSIPCPEPCSVWIVFAEEASGWEIKPPLPEFPHSNPGFAEFAKSGNLLRERWLGEFVE